MHLLTLIDFTKIYIRNSFVLCKITGLEKAFDTIDHDIVVAKSSHFGIYSLTNN